MLELDAVSKSIDHHGNTMTVLNNIKLRLEKGASLAIVGPSGSGKSTLLSLMAGMDTASGGSVILDGDNLTTLGEEQRAQVRADKIGFVFQSFQLMPTLTALENVAVPLDLKGDKNAEEKASEMLARVGLSHRSDHLPSQLSGGEQQRVAIARAFVKRPAYLFADEPTGNLDYKNSEAIIELLFELNQQYASTLVLVTHDNKLAARCSEQIHLIDGEAVGSDPSANGASALRPAIADA